MGLPALNALSAVLYPKTPCTGSFASNTRMVMFCEVVEPSALVAWTVTTCSTWDSKFNDLPAANTIRLPLSANNPPAVLVSESVMAVVSGSVACSDKPATAVPAAVFSEMVLALALVSLICTGFKAMVTVNWPWSDLPPA